jgi:hexosaminidase
MSTNIVFLPMPRQVSWHPERHALRAERLIVLTGADPQVLKHAGLRFSSALQARLGYRWQVVASSAIPQDLQGLVLQVDPSSPSQPQGYQLTITPDQIFILAPDPAGVFYGVCTLIQLLEQSEAELPCLSLSDWPDFPARGVMLDISRDKVPTLETAFHLVDLLASWKVNQFQLYTEHTFAYRQHPQVWAQASPFTGEEILALDAYCRERFIELVPNQNSFGHLHRWLVHPRYAPLAEINGPFEAPWGRVEGPFSLAPADPGSLALILSLYDELLPHFSSRKVNIGCDETFDLGAGRSRALVAQRGAGRVYLDFLLRLHENMQARGCTVLFWGDIILQHPELIPELPRDLVALAWGYEADHPFDQECAAFAASGIPFYVCPGTSSWNSLAGRTSNALGNLLSAAENGLKHGASGYLNTDWGDSGHWQALPVSYLGYAAGAAYSWALEVNRGLHLPTVLDRFAFHDAAAVLGRLAYDLGEAYRWAGVTLPNASLLFGLLQRPLAEVRAYPGLAQLHLADLLERLDQASASLPSAQPTGPDAELLRREFRLTADLLRHACRRGQLAQFANAGLATAELATELERDLQALLEAYRAAWLSRNRPGGLDDSAGRLERARQDYLPA